MVEIVYVPRSSDSQRVLVVYMHGGGWVSGDLDMHDPTCRSLATGADGAPEAFGINVRYVYAAVLAGLVLVPLPRLFDDRRRQRWLLGALLIVLVLTDRLDIVPRAPIVEAGRDLERERHPAAHGADATHQPLAVPAGLTRLRLDGDGPPGLLPPRPLDRYQTPALAYVTRLALATTP
mgnify:CR=1 FL=1